MADGSVCNEGSFTLADAIGASRSVCTTSTSHSPRTTDRRSLTRLTDGLSSRAAERVDRQASEVCMEGHKSWCSRMR